MRKLPIFLMVLLFFSCQKKKDDTTYIHVKYEITPPAPGMKAREIVYWDANENEITISTASMTDSIPLPWTLEFDAPRRRSNTVALGSYSSRPDPLMRDTRRIYVDGQLMGTYLNEGVAMHVF